MIRTPTQIEKGENVDSVAENFKAVGSWRDELASLGELKAAEASLLAELEHLKGKKIIVPKMKVVVTDPALFDEQASELDKELFEDLITFFVHSHHASDTEVKADAKERLKAYGPNSDHASSSGWYVEFDGAPTLEDLPASEQQPPAGGSDSSGSSEPGTPTA